MSAVGSRHCVCRFAYWKLAQYAVDAGHLSITEYAVVLTAKFTLMPAVLGTRGVYIDTRQNGHMRLTLTVTRRIALAND